MTGVVRIVRDELQVALGVHMGAIDDQGLTVFEALGDVEVAAVTYASTLSLEHLDDLFSAWFSLAAAVQAVPHQERLSN